MRVRGGSFVDEDGRTLMLRGVSFIGRPFPLDESDEHFARLREWGFTFLRLLVPWEAVGFDLSRLDETGAAITHLAQPCMEVGPGEHTPHGVSPAERRAGSGMAHG
jgi:hypothetical protein